MKIKLEIDIQGNEFDRVPAIVQQMIASGTAHGTPRLTPWNHPGTHYAIAGTPSVPFPQSSGTLGGTTGTTVDVPNTTLEPVHSAPVPRRATTGTASRTGVGVALACLALSGLVLGLSGARKLTGHEQSVSPVKVVPKAERSPLKPSAVNPLDELLPVQKR